MKNIKSNIGWLMVKTGRTRAYFAKRYGKTPTTISNWCTGKSYPSVKELFDLAEQLNVKVDDLYSYKDDD